MSRLRFRPVLTGFVHCPVQNWFWTGQNSTLIRIHLLTICICQNFIMWLVTVFRLSRFCADFSWFWSMCRFLTDTRQMGLNMTKILEFNIRHFLSKFKKNSLNIYGISHDFVKINREITRNIQFLYKIWQFSGLIFLVCPYADVLTETLVSYALSLQDNIMS